MFHISKSQVCNMNVIFIVFCTIVIEFASATTKINVQELRCLVCEASLQELDTKIKQIDPDRQVDVGGYRLDADGNYRKKTVSQAKSEVHLSELVDEICNKMDDYVRATWKDTGKLTILPLITSAGSMNPDMGRVDVIQDDDLNKSLKYYCEGIMEEYEENIIKHYTNDSDNIHIRVCSQEARLCSRDIPDKKDAGADVIENKFDDEL